MVHSTIKLCRKFDYQHLIEQKGSKFFMKNNIVINACMLNM